MLDISRIAEGEDLGLANTEAVRAGNVLSVDLASLEYAPEFGVDLRFFLSENLNIQKESFKAYLVQRLTENHINVNSVVSTVEAFLNRFVFFVGDAADAIGFSESAPQSESLIILSEDGATITSEDGETIVGG